MEIPRCFPRVAVLLATSRRSSATIGRCVLRGKSSSSHHSTAEYCVHLVRQHDYENFLCTLLLSNPCRTSAFAVRAFNIEIARVQDNVTDVAIGHMRMKFWEETLEKIYQDNCPDHPVAIEVNRARKMHKLSKRYLKRLITMRANQLTSSQFSNMEELELYAENSVSSVYYLLLECAGIQNVHADHVASHLGKAQGITNLIRSTPHSAQQNRVMLPREILLQYNVSEEMVLRRNSSKSLRDVVFSVATRARHHLDMARSLCSNVPRQAYTLFLPAVSVDSYLEKLRLTDFDVFHGNLQQRNSILPLKLFWNKLQSKY